MKQKVLIVFGTRPEAIKMAPVVAAFRKHHTRFDTRVCVTGQHRHMLDTVLELFCISPEYDLNIMKPGQDLYEITAAVLLGMRTVLNDFQPDLVFVHGDTTSSAIAAMASFYLKIPVAHIEAGLRTHDVYNPWPEEMNRSLTARLATWHLAPTPLAKENLMRENVDENRILVAGNTIIDALLDVSGRLFSDVQLLNATGKIIEQAGYSPERLYNRRLVLITGHRRENFGEGFVNICNAVKELAQHYPSVDFVYPVHLNPNVREPVFEILDPGGADNIFLLDPLDYLPFIFLMNKAAILLTDSGGIQEEATVLGKPVVVMRSVSERPEAMQSGFVHLAGTDATMIISLVSGLLDGKIPGPNHPDSSNPFGDGHAADKIVNFFLSDR